MHSDIQQYVQSCISCQKAKPASHKKPTPLQPLPVLDVFRRVHMDIMGPFRKSTDGYTHVLLIVDSFSKYMEIFPLQSTSATTVADIFYKQWINRYSAPDSILTDRGQNFLSKVLKEMCRMFEIKKINTSSYRPQTNSTCERNNKTIAEKLRMFIKDDQSDWPDKLSGIAYAMNTSICTESTHYSPYYIVFGRQSRNFVDTVLTNPTNVGNEAKQYIDYLHKQLKETREIARRNTLDAQEKYKTQHDKKAEHQNFRLRQKVWMENKQIPVGLSRKLCNKWDGPYYISANNGNQTYKLRRCSDNLPLKGPVNANRLKPYFDPEDRPTNPVDDPPDDADDESDDTDADDPPEDNTVTDEPPMHGRDDDDDLYLVERIVRAKRINNKPHYFIKWLGFNYSDNTWEPEENIPDEIIQEFKCRKDNEKLVKARKARKRRRS